MKPSSSVILALSFLIHLSDSVQSCKCRTVLNQKEAVCAAGWVSHVTILNKTQVTVGPHHLIDYSAEETVRVGK
jgi:hypothetical protein